jgi:hypothetical protein
MYLIEEKGYDKRWEPVLTNDKFAPITSQYRRDVTTIVLENQFREAKNQEQMLSEDAPANNISSTAGIDKYDPILISLVRRSLPNLMAYDICGVQPMTGPTGLIFALKSKYGTDRSNTGIEALFNEADTDFAGTGTHVGTNPVDGNPYTTGTGMPTADAEALGTGGAGGVFAEMTFSIEKTSVTALSRALKGEYTIELAQDLKAVHGADAEGELSNILSQEMLAEINREVVRTIYKVAKVGAASTAVPGTFNLDVDSNGRWSVERFKGLMFQIERDANVIGQQTRRGKGNFIIVSADVGSALAMAGKLDYATGLTNNLEIDDTGNTFAGVLNGRFKVFIDPYSANISAASQFYVVGYKGKTPYDAGIFYCPYVPLQMVRATDPNSFQPKIGFKTRYGMVSNPFVTTNGLQTGAPDAMTFTAGANQYFRKVKVTNLM